MKNDFLSIIKTRRSIRTYKTDHVPSNMLDAVLEAGTYAPTGGSHQSPTIIAVTLGLGTVWVHREREIFDNEKARPFCGNGICRKHCEVLGRSHWVTRLMKPVSLHRENRITLFGSESHLPGTGNCAAHFLEGGKR